MAVGQGDVFMEDGDLDMEDGRYGAGSMMRRSASAGSMGSAGYDDGPRGYDDEHEHGNQGPGGYDDEHGNQGPGGYDDRYGDEARQVVQCNCYRIKSSYHYVIYIQRCVYIYIYAYMQGKWRCSGSGRLLARLHASGPLMLDIG